MWVICLQMYTTLLHLDPPGAHFMRIIYRTNLVLFTLYALICAGVFSAVFFSPQFRALAYAPLRELLLPPPEPVVISVLYSTEKEAWLKEAASAFESSGAQIDGHPITVQLEPMGSREMYLAVLDGSRQPDMISPASMLQVAILQDLSAAQNGAALVNPADQVNCRSVVTTPLVLVAWKERADVLWGQAPGPELWKELQKVVVDPNGWAAYNHPEWGYLKFGHTNPLRSNSGFMTILLMTYGYYGRTSGLEAGEILSNPEYQQWFLDFERTISQFEPSTGPLMQKMIAYGPSTYDLTAVYEANAIEQADNAVGRYGELRVYYPPASIWSDHPFCVVSAPWVSSQKAGAARQFLDYLSSRPMQELALLKYGFRPADAGIPLDQPGSPFQRYTANGFLADISSIPAVEVPPGNVLNTLLEFWSRNHQ